MAVRRVLLVLSLVAAAALLVFAWLRYPVATEALVPLLVAAAFAALLMRAVLLRSRAGAGQEPVGGGPGPVRSWLEGNAPLAADMGGSGTWQEGVTKSLWTTPEVPERSLSLSFHVPGMNTERVRDATERALAATRDATPRLDLSAEGWLEPESARALVRLSLRGTPGRGEVARVRAEFERTFRRALEA